jgi:hypothetical protein
MRQSLATAVCCVVSWDRKVGGGMSLKKTSPKSFDFGAYFFLGDCFLFSKKMKLFSKTKIINSHLQYKNSKELFFKSLFSMNGNLKQTNGLFVKVSWFFEVSRVSCIFADMS